MALAALALPAAASAAAVEVVAVGVSHLVLQVKAPNRKSCN